MGAELLQADSMERLTPAKQSPINVEAFMKLEPDLRNNGTATECDTVSMTLCQSSTSLRSKINNEVEISLII